MKKRIFKINFLLTILFTTLAFYANAQYYGSAYVKVKPTSGNYRYINVVTGDPLYTFHRSESEAKRELLGLITNQLQEGEEEISSVYYDINESKGIGSFKGTASVSVKNENGKQRTINVLVGGGYEVYKTKSAAMRELYKMIENKKNYGEVFNGSIYYDIN